MVQLGSFKTDAEAAKHWNELSEKFPDLFKPLTYTPAEVMLPPDDFVYHRTQAGPVPTRAEAERICARVTQEHQECYVVETAMFSGNDTKAIADAAATPPPAVPAQNATAFDANEASPPPPAPAPMPVAAPVEPVAAAEPSALPPAPPAPAPSPFGQPTPPAVSSAPPVAAPADVHVAEAIPVPLSDPRLSGQASPYGDGFRGTPGSYNRFMPFWAEIGYFDSQRGALGYWSVLRSRDSLIPSSLRLRITQPFQQRALSSKLSLRVGPFTSVEPVRRLCALTKPEQLGCRAVRDLGGSIAYQPSDGSQATRGARQNPYMLRRMGLGSPVASPAATPRPASPFGGPTPPHGGFGAGSSASGTYWVQLGSFMAPQAAHDKWDELKSSYPALSRQNEQVYPSPSGSLWRLRSGPFSTAGQALSLCNRLKADGALCVVTAE